MIVYGTKITIELRLNLRLAYGLLTIVRTTSERSFTLEIFCWVELTVNVKRQKRQNQQLKYLFLKLTSTSMVLIFIRIQQKPPKSFRSLVAYIPSNLIFTVKMRKFFFQNSLRFVIGFYEGKKYPNVNEFLEQFWRNSVRRP